MTVWIKWLTVTISVVITYSSNTDTQIVGEDSTIDGMSDKANITNFLNELTIRDTILLKAIEQCFA